MALTDDTIQMIDTREKDIPDAKDQAGNNRLLFKNGHVGLVKSMIVSADETVLFTGGMDASMLVWDIRKRQVMTGFGAIEKKNSPVDLKR